MSVDTQLYLISLIVALLLSSIFVLTEYWELFLVAGIIAGALNKKMKKGALSGAVGVSIVWFVYMINAIITRNAYASLDQFAAFILGDLGFGWLLFILIMLLGTLIGALGGAIGSGITILLSKESINENTEHSTDKNRVFATRIQK